MRIDELTIQNFKCFENETFHFDPHFNVVIGKNASGKTSLLDALAIAIGTYPSFLVKSSNNIDVSNVRTVIVDGQPKPQLPSQIIFDLHFDGEDTGKSFVSIEKLTGEIFGSEGAFDTIKIRAKATNDLQESRSANSKVNFPLIAYYGTGRLWKNNSKIDYFKQEEGVFLGYKDCLAAQASSNTFISWYKTLEDTVSKFKQPLHEQQLKLFKETISSMIPEWTDMAFNYLEDDLMGIFKNENGALNMLPFKNLSDGYRNMIGMVADMVYRCLQLNPGLKENAVSATEGVVLIDEIDLHLHPEWQKSVVGNLKRVFPKIQFIATTHSPFIVQSLSKDELIILGDEKIADKDPWRQSIEEIAADEMEVTDVRRSELFKEREAIASEYFTLVKQNDTKDTLRQKIDEAKKRLDQLTIEFSDDPAYVTILRSELEKAENHAANNKN